MKTEDTLHAELTCKHIENHVIIIIATQNKGISEIRCQFAHMGTFSKEPGVHDLDSYIRKFH